MSRQPTIYASDSDLSAIARGGSINLAGLLFSFLSNVLYQFILVRTLSTDDVGLFNLSVTVSGLLGLIVLFGLDRSVVRYIAYYWGKGDRPRELGVTVTSVSVLLLLTVAITPLFWLVADDVARFIFQKPELTPVLRIFVLTVPFMTTTRLLMGILQGYKRMKPIVLIEQMGVPALRIIGIALILIALAQTNILVSYSFLIASVFGCVAALVVVGRFFLARKQDERPVCIYSELLRYSWPLFGASLLNRTNTYAETLILGALSSSQQVGIYTVSFKVAFTVTVIFQSINSILAPHIAEAYAQQDLGKLAHQFRAVTRWILTLTLPVGLVMLLEANDIMALLKPEYVAGAPILRILTLSHLASVVVGPVALILTMTRHAHINLAGLFATLLLSLALDFTLIPRYGAYGAAISGAMAILFLNIWRLVQVYLRFGVHPYNWSTLKPVVAGGIAALVTWSGSQLLRVNSPLWRLTTLSLLLLLTYSISVVALGQEDVDRKVFSILLRDLTDVHLGKADSHKA